MGRGVAAGLLCAAVAGVSLLAGSAASAPAKKGGTMRLNLSATDVDFTDPSLAYGTISWQIEYATALKLVNYPDKPSPRATRLQPEAAAGMPLVSKNGKQYTFKIKKGLRLSNGERVTAKNFQRAIFRVLNTNMHSPGARFITDIRGAPQMIDGHTKTGSGVIANGNTLVIKLTQPDGGLLSKLAMPFFQAISLRMPLAPKGVDSYPSGGPYSIASRVVNRRIVLKKNKFYKGARPRSIDTFDITVNTSPDQSLLEVKSNQSDYEMGSLPPAAHADLAKTYGVNKGQYQVHPLVETDYVALNTSRPTFGNVALRKAANYAIDRPAMLRVRGAFAGRGTDQILPPGMGGFKDAKVYPLKGADYAKAKALAGDKCGPVNLYTVRSLTGVELANEFRYNLTQMGCEVTVKAFPLGEFTSAIGTRGSQFDAALVSSLAAYPDPFDFMSILLDGTRITNEHNTNISYFNNAKVNRLLERANRLVGPARYKAYANLDVLITKNYAPWAAYDNRNEREFVSNRVKNFVYQPVYGGADLAAFALK